MERDKNTGAVVAITLSEAAQRVREQLKQYGKSMEFLGLVDTLASDKDSVEGLVEIVASNDRYPYPQYASHLLLHIARSYTDKLEMYYERLLDTILFTTNSSVQRNLLGVILCFPLRPYREGELLDWLFSALNHPESKPGLINYSVKKLAQYVADYPDLAQEIRLALVLREEQSGSFRRLEWGKSILRSIKRNTS